MTRIGVLPHIITFICFGCLSVTASGAAASDTYADEFTVREAPADRKPMVVNMPEKAEGTVRKKAHKCFKCGGTGHVSVSVREVCERCDGTGTVVLEVELKDTEHTFDGWWGPRTRKTTRKAYSKQPCPRCNRRGKISVKKEIECSCCKGKGEW